MAHTVIVAGFFPRHGRCLLDDWGADPEERAAERADIEQAAMMWAPPPVEGVAADPGLDSDQARWLGRRLQPHPGRTVLEPASMSRPITEQSVTVIANVGEGDPVATLPADLADTDLTKWNFREIAEGHWPMLGCPTRLDEVLLESATLAASERPEPEIELGTPADSRFGGGS